MTVVVKKKMMVMTVKLQPPKLGGSGMAIKLD